VIWPVREDDPVTFPDCFQESVKSDDGFRLVIKRFHELLCLLAGTSNSH